MDILLIGGLWLDGSAWDAVASALEELGHRPVPLTLPGQGDGASRATLDDQVTAVIAALDAAPEKSLVVGHSAACTLAWMAADARPDKVAAAVLIGGFPSGDGEVYADFFPVSDGVMQFPGWEPFDGPDSADLDEETKRRMGENAIPVPAAVSTAIVHYTNSSRFNVPVILVCPEFSPADARAWIESGDVPAVAKAKAVEYVDIDSGHWPMFTRPGELAGVVAKSADAVAKVHPA